MISEKWIHQKRKDNIWILETLPFDFNFFENVLQKSFEILTNNIFQKVCLQIIFKSVIYEPKMNNINHNSLNLS